MTWVKTGTEFPADAANVDLSDAAYRTHHEVLTWICLVERMDCRIPKRLLRKVATTEGFEVAAKELVGLGWWRDRGDEFEVIHHADTTRSSLGAQRKQRETSKKTSQTYRLNHPGK